MVRLRVPNRTVRTRLSTPHTHSRCAPPRRRRPTMSAQTRTQMTRPATLTRTAAKPSVEVKIDLTRAIDERQLADVDGPALLRLLAALPPRHPSREKVRAQAI